MIREKLAEHIFILHNGWQCNYLYPNKTWATLDEGAKTYHRHEADAVIAIFEEMLDTMELPVCPFVGEGAYKKAQQDLLKAIKKELEVKDG